MGRGAGDYIFNIGDFGEEGSLDRRLYHSVSFTHLEIFRTSEGVFLTDNSSNGELLLDILSGQDCNSGTWIDGVKVGKGSTRVLKNTAEIAFPHQSKKMFVFISDEKDKDMFPQELTSKVTVGKLIFYQLASAVKYLHSRNICHRDLKPENVLLVSSDQHNLHVKIADMGLSKLVEKTHLKTFCGTRCGRNIFRILNSATNIFTQAVHGSGDLRVPGEPPRLHPAGGLLGPGGPPLRDDLRHPTLLRGQDGGYGAQRSDSHCQFRVLSRPVRHIPVDAKDMIEKLLVADPKKRLTTEQILQHSWLQVIPFLYHSKRADT